MNYLMFFCAFFIIGLVLLYLGFYFQKLNRNIAIYGIKTKAKVVDFIIEEIEDSEGFVEECSYPIVSFKDLNGNDFAKKLNTTSNTDKINEIIDIIYIKEKDDFKIVRNNRFWLNTFPFLFKMFGVVFFCLSAFSLYLKYK